MQDLSTQGSNRDGQEQSNRSKKRMMLDKFKAHLSGVVDKVNSMVKKDDGKLPK